MLVIKVTCQCKPVFHEGISTLSNSHKDI